MRIYARDQVCSFRFTHAAWGAFSNFQPLAVPIAAGPWTFPTSEHAYQACKFPARPDVQQRIADAPTAREALATGPLLQPVCNTCGGTGVQVDAWACWDTQTQRWVLHSTYEAAAICADCDVECSYTMKPVAEAA